MTSTSHVTCQVPADTAEQPKDLTSRVVGKSSLRMREALHPVMAGLGPKVGHVRTEVWTVGSCGFGGRGSSCWAQRFVGFVPFWIRRSPSKKLLHLPKLDEKPQPTNRRPRQKGTWQQPPETRQATKFGCEWALCVCGWSPALGMAVGSSPVVSAPTPPPRPGDVDGFCLGNNDCHSDLGSLL